MSETITVSGRECRVYPRSVCVEPHVYDHGVALRLDDPDRDEFWMNIHIPKDIVLAWAKQLQEMENANDTD